MFISGDFMAKKPAAPAVEAPATEASPSVIGVRGPKGVPMEAKITLLVPANPKRPASFVRFAAYIDGMTVKEALDAGIWTADLVYDAKHAFVAIEGYNPEIIVKAPKAEKAAKAPKAKKAKAEPTESDLELEAATAEETID
jgi:hypothetical protein